MDGENIPIAVTLGSGGRSNISSVISQQGAVNLLGHTPRLAEDGVFGSLTLAGVIPPAVLRLQRRPSSRSWSRLVEPPAAFGRRAASPCVIAQRSYTPSRKVDRHG
ncbi:MULTISPECIES: hypothetical protein [Streptomyces]|uniref:hypothetical protein n=1 Tax=Streptomyces TaxID=1883 RepID=UPI00148779B6|nr:MULTISPECIES: hypothetical protein [Streptomyces]